MSARWTEVGSGYPIVVCSAPAVPYEYWAPLLESLSSRFRCIFVHGRGLWDGYLPRDPKGMSVGSRVGDIMSVAECLSLEGFGVLGHCSAVTVVLASVPRLRTRPEAALLVSGRSGYSAVGNFDAVASLIRSDSRFREHYARLAAAYAPAELREGLEQQLLDERRLEGHVYSLQSLRLYSTDFASLGNMPVALAWAQEDMPGVSDTMQDYADRLGRQCEWTHVFEGDHFAFIRNTEVGARLVERAFERFAYPSHLPEEVDGE